MDYTGDTSTSSVDADGTLLLAQPCSVDVSVGHFVSTSGGNFVPAISNSVINSRWVGCVVAKDSTTQCDVKLGGDSGNIYSGTLVADAEYYLSTVDPGAISTSKSSARGHVAAPVGRAISTSRLIIRPTVGTAR